MDASDLKQNLFGRALEDIFEFDPTEFYSILSTHTVKQLAFPYRNIHIVIKNPLRESFISAKDTVVILMIDLTTITSHPHAGDVGGACPNSPEAR